jgi:hypothetical protein
MAAFGWSSLAKLLPAPCGIARGVGICCCLIRPPAVTPLIAWFPTIVSLDCSTAQTHIWCLLYCCTAVLLYYCTAVLLYCCTAVLLYCCTAFSRLPCISPLVSGVAAIPSAICIRCCCHTISHLYQVLLSYHQPFVSGDASLLPSVLYCWWYTVRCWWFFNLDRKTDQLNS